MFTTSNAWWDNSIVQGTGIFIMKYGQATIASLAKCGSNVRANSSSKTAPLESGIKAACYCISTECLCIEHIVISAL